jgi:enolase-phosphatase E1
MPGISMIPRAIVTDIEGTTSSLAFVHEILFPYSRARLAAFVATHVETMEQILNDTRAVAQDSTLTVDDCVALLLAWHDEDRKITPLKTLQGMIWAVGFAAGELKGHIYSDAVAGLRRWHSRGIRLYVYSSGSVAAQKLLFGHTEFGDLTSLFSGHFDTGVGGKKEAASYRSIARVLALPPSEILFLSDVDAELTAGHEAGLAVTLIVRDRPIPYSRFPTANTFDSIVPDIAL